MKLNSLKLTNWRNIRETELDLRRLSVIRGANHQGKSGLAQAIAFALTGRCAATDARGGGATGLIRTGADKALIEMRVVANKEVAVRCSLTAASGRNVTIADPKDKTWKSVGVEHWFDAQRDVLSCLFDTGYFIGLDPADQKGLLSSLILPDSFEFPEEKLQQLKSFDINRQGRDMPLFEQIEFTYNAAFNRRRDLNRDLRNLHIPEPLAQPENAPASGDDARAKLASLRATVYEKERTWRGAVKQCAEGRAQIANLEQRVQALEAKVRTEEETLSSNEKLVLSAGQLKDRKKTAENEGELDRLNGQVLGLRTTITEARGILRSFDALGDKSNCPTCRQAITEEMLLAAMAPHKEKLDVTLKGEKATVDAIKALGDVAGAKADLERHETAKTSVARSRDIIRETHGLLKTAEMELADLTAKLPAEPPQDSEVPELRKQIEALERSLDAIAVFEARANEITLWTARETALKADIAIVEELVEYFGPKGIKAQLLADNIGQFTAAMNAALAAWGYACQFQIEPYGFQVMADEGSLPLALLSGSERLQFGIAFQVALAQVSGIGMVIIDEADLFDSAGRGALYPMLLDSPLDQAIVIGTDEREEAPDLGDEGIFYTMRDGKAVALQPAAAVAA